MIKQKLCNIIESPICVGKQYTIEWTRNKHSSSLILTDCTLHNAHPMAVKVTLILRRVLMARADDLSVEQAEC